MPEDELNAADPPDREAVMRYLTEGGLLAIMQSNLAGGLGAGTRRGFG
jgi:hypothetical protein